MGKYNLCRWEKQVTNMHWGGGGGSTNHMYEMLNDVFKGTKCDDVNYTQMNHDRSKFYGYMDNANEVMYLGCEFTKLSLIVLSISNVSTKLGIGFLICYLTFWIVSS